MTVACEQQTHFWSSLLSLQKNIFRGRESMTGNVSAVRRLAKDDSCHSILQLY